MLLNGTDLQKFGTALKTLEVRIFHDLREARPFWQKGKGDALPCDDRAMAWLRVELAARFEHMVQGKPHPYRLGKEMFYTLRDAICHLRERDRFGEWLSALKPTSLTTEQMSGYETALDWMIDDCLGGASSDYHRHISRMLCLGAVWRTFQPGCKLDEVPVLKGAQGVGKDALLSSLVPWPSLVTTSFSFGMRDKEKVEVTRGRVFVVASEMGGVTTTKDLEHLKSYVTATSDDTRLSYRRDADVMPRRFVFACTTNLAKPLPTDSTGNRRWCVVEVEESKVGPVEPWIANKRKRLWGDAMALYKAGVKPNMPRDLQGVQSGLNDALTRVDEQFEDAFEQAFDGGLMEHGRPYTLSELAVLLKIADTEDEFRRGRREDQHRLRDQLEQQKWTSRRARRDGSPVKRLWFPPEK